MMKGQSVVKGLAVLVCLLMLSAPSVMAGPLAGLPCNGNFDGDLDVDADDVTEFLVHFGRSQYNDPYPTDGPARVPKTGQTTCYDSDGVVIDCAGTGQDGEYQRGMTTDPRFTDHGIVVTDNLTGLMWVKDSQQICESNYVTWQVALDLCNDLDYAGYNDWRLPNLRELESLVIWENSPSLPIGHPFINQILFRFWSSTTKANTVSNYPDYAWTVDFTNAIREYGLKSHTFAYVRPVRGGH